MGAIILKSEACVRPIECLKLDPPCVHFDRFDGIGGPFIRCRACVWTPVLSLQGALEVVEQYGSFGALRATGQRRSRCHIYRLAFSESEGGF